MTASGLREAEAKCAKLKPGSVVDVYVGGKLVYRFYA